MNIVKNSGKSKGGSSFQKKYGLGEFKVVLVNPSNEELSEFLGTEIKEELEYVTEDREGNTKVIIKFWLEEVSTGYKIPAQFNIYDKVSTSKSGKTQYVNQIGMSTWADSKNDLKDWFTHFTNKNKNIVAEKNYRVAYQGEADFYAFIATALNEGSDFYNPETDLFLDTKKIFRGKFEEIQSILKSEFLGTVMALVYVESYEREGDVKKISKVWTRNFLQGYCLRTIKSKGKKANKNIERFFNDISGEYGCKGEFITEALADYEEDDAPKATNSKVAEHVEYDMGDDDDDNY